jgi:hypothetical protein
MDIMPGVTRSVEDGILILRTLKCTVRVMALYTLFMGYIHTFLIYGTAAMSNPALSALGNLKIEGILVWA